MHSRVCSGPDLGHAKHQIRGQCDGSVSMYHQRPCVSHQRLLSVAALQGTEMWLGWRSGPIGEPFFTGLEEGEFCFYLGQSQITQPEIG